MKRILAALLMVTLLLYGCGGKTNDSTKIDDGREEIVFNPAYVAIDDKNIKMEVTSVSKTVAGKGTKNQFDKYDVNLKITNKNEKYDVNVYLFTDSAYIGAYGVVFSSAGGVKAGKINDSLSFSCIATGPAKNRGGEHLTSVKDLLDFNATVYVRTYEDAGGYTVTQEEYAVDVSLEDAKY